MVTPILEAIGIEYPIIQAPMAGGITTPELVANVSKNGGLGMIAAGYLNPDQLKVAIHEVKNRVDQPFGVNLFVPNDVTYSSQHVENMQLMMKNVYDELQITDYNVDEFPKYKDQQAVFEQHLQVILDETIKVCSFTFGLPNEDQIKQLKQAGVYTIGTATTVKEALIIQDLGMDAVVMQGSEAGGHRSNFISSFHEGNIGLMALVPQAVQEIKIPIIAAGGIMNGSGIRACLQLGAQAAQMGTAFLTLKESGAQDLHKNAILYATEDELVLTKAFSGKWARGIRNEFTEEMNANEAMILPFPIQNSLTKPIRKEAAKQNQAAYMSLWSGQAPRLATDDDVSTFMNRLIKELNEGD
ncbi:2-nitropropane dioxygenase [Oceanobacillus iheyensis HTE831]|uniref:Probable nitronate monooxygenase n=1 Tax=Oceanobacillus iheyensis (strain DSM 14371 / CIP 107618 / JCM 11309 / KCTC 3954 / HTE831) TaxID=221109 RepID=Q8ES18_OCEIH|nr:nitronate monooxygenase [Oceanobacillus iheyensis]BAC12782.1 2-nitropropane dioxygenase [Oceanobacillus iheyensis HTE831]